ncbi:MAG: phosphotransferase [Thermoguttaceae bacterium]|nr:phosphotransferase [Thermoguttaceae bacterium]
MTKPHRRHLDVLCNYHDDYVALGTEFLGNAGGYSGACFWKVHGKKGTFCLRRWAKNYPTLERLQYIHAVQWHAQTEGFCGFPMPVETLEGMTCVEEGGFYWQLEPWMKGKADFLKNPNTNRLVSAMTALAEFHNATQTFPILKEKGTSPLLLEHEKTLLRWTDSRLAELEDRVGLDGMAGSDLFQDVTFISGLSDSDGPAGTEGWQIGNRVTIPCKMSIKSQTRLQNAALRILPRVRELRRPVLTQVVRKSNQLMRLQPCLYDIHSEHLFFEKDRFVGFIDFGSLGNDNAAVDVARMLSALTGSQGKYWLTGLAAYQSVRPLRPEELAAIQVIRRSLMLSMAIRWLEYIFTQSHPVMCSTLLVQRLERLADILERV